MGKRVAATVLWFLAGWYGGAFLAFFAGLSPIVGPVLGLGAAALVAVDPRHSIWGSDRA